MYLVNKNIQRILKERKLMHKAVAEKMCISPQCFSNIVRCKRQVYADEVIPLARALNVSVEALFREPVEEADCG